MILYKYSDREIKIAEWLGFKWQQSRHYSEDSYWRRMPATGLERYPRTPGGIPHFDNDDGAAISLLPKLAELGYETSLILTASGGASFDISKNFGHVLFSGEGETICSAISAAILKLIESI